MLVIVWAQMRAAVAEGRTDAYYRPACGIFAICGVHLP
jgi:hypothetical protein